MDDGGDRDKEMKVIEVNGKRHNDFDELLNTKYDPNQNEMKHNLRFQMKINSKICSINIM